jgi:hypothetical protein
MSKIKSLDAEVLKQYSYPVSLDVENMYHNIPRQQALAYLKDKLNNTLIDTCSISADNIVSLVAECLNINHFKHNGTIFFQKQGLPMGNRLSGILAELFIEKIINETYQILNMDRPTYRYVDDLLIFTKNESDAQQIFTSFNDNPYGLKFTLELPENKEIAYLDFKLQIDNEGIAKFDFHRKPTRKDNFVNANTALPSRSIGNIIANERRRIKNRCSDNTKFLNHQHNFLNRLVRNEHKPNTIRFMERKTERNPTINSSSNSQLEPKFYLSIPYISDQIEYKIKNALKGLGVSIQIAHKGTKLKHTITKSNQKMKCTMRGCSLKNNLCMVRGSVYDIRCNQCGDFYIGSSWRYLHTRFKEHLTQKASPIYTHNQRCKGQLTIKVLAVDENIQRMRIKEAILIKKLQPTLNGKEDLFKSHILFE